jgi:hypothetical protein
MADRYLVHGLYGSASFTASTTNNSTSLNVTAIASGRIALGSVITGPNVPANTVITAYGTGRGGTGTYTMSANATATASGQSMTSINGHVSLDPEWGVAQEGDGTGTGAAIPATVSIDLSAYTAAAGATIAIGGATLTCVASGAGNNQFNAGSGTTLIDNIVTAINRTTNSVTVNAAASGWATPLLQNAVFARRSGNNLEIMTRAGSSTYNSNSSFKVVTTGLTGGSQIDQTFSGGAGGAWGLLCNPVYASHPSALSAGSYGVLGGTVGPQAGTLSSGDRVFCRAARTFTSFGTGFVVNPRVIGALGNPVRIVIDDGTVWTEDGSTPVFEMVFRGTQAQINGVVFGKDCHVAFEGKTYSNGTKNLQIKGRIADASGSIRVGVDGGVATMIMKGFELSEISGNLGDVQIVASNNATRSRFSGFKIASAKNNNRFFSFASYSRQAYATFDGFEVNATGSTAVNTGVAFVSNSSLGIDARFASGSFTGFVVGSTLITGQGSSTVGGMSLDDVELGNVTQVGPFFASTSRAAPSVYADFSLSYVRRRGARDFFCDRFRGLVAWNSSRSQPVCGAVLDDGVTGWSIMAIPSTLSANIDAVNPLTLPRLAKINSLADGARTFKLRFVAEQALTVDKSRVSMVVTYTDVNNNLVVLDTYDPDGAAISTDTTTWTNESGGFVTYQNGGTVNHNKYVLTVSTPPGKNLKNGVEVGVVVSINSPGSTLVQSYFFDPDFTIE